MVYKFIYEKVDSRYLHVIRDDLHQIILLGNAKTLVSITARVSHILFYINML